MSGGERWKAHPDVALTWSAQRACLADAVGARPPLLVGGLTEEFWARLAMGAEEAELAACVPELQAEQVGDLLRELESAAWVVRG